MFIDINSAFDNVLPNILITDLLKLGLPSSYAKFIYALLTERKIQFVINGELSQPYHSHKGVPQGSVLSPILFNLYLREIGKSLDEGTEILQFADDIVLISRNENLNASIESLQTSVNKINKYLLRRNLEISPTKSSLIIFSRKKTLPPIQNIQINNTPIPINTSYKFLVLLDQKLSGHPHIDAVSNKCKKLLSLLKFLSGT